MQRPLQFTETDIAHARGDIFGELFLQPSDQGGAALVIECLEIAHRGD